MSATNKSDTLQLEIRIGGERAMVTIALDADGDWSVQLEHDVGTSRRLDDDAHEFIVPTSQQDTDLRGSCEAAIRAVYRSE